MATADDPTGMHEGVEWLDGSISASPVDWQQVALSDSGAFEEGLRELGLHDDAVEEATSLVGEVRGHLSVVDDEIETFRYEHRFVQYFMTPPELEELYFRRLSIMERLGNWFSGRDLHVTRTEQATVDVPVFVLSAPGVPGCKAAFKLASETATNFSCELKVYGTGLSGGKDSACRARCEFRAEAGDVKIVFVRAELTIGEVDVLVDGASVGQGTMITAIEFPPPSTPGAKIVTDPEVARLGAHVTTFPLAGDKPGDPEAYGYEYEQSTAGGFSLGLKAFGADIGLKAEITLKQSVALDFELIGGHDYPLHCVAEGQGIAWKLG